MSDDMVPLVARAGFRWMATDEAILARSLGRAFTRDGAGNVEQPEDLYRPYRVGASGLTRRLRLQGSHDLGSDWVLVRVLAGGDRRR